MVCLLKKKYLMGALKLVFFSERLNIFRRQKLDCDSLFCWASTWSTSLTQWLQHACIHILCQMWCNQWQSYLMSVNWLTHFVYLVAHCFFQGKCSLVGIHTWHENFHYHCPFIFVYPPASPLDLLSPDISVLSGHSPLSIIPHVFPLLATSPFP